MPGMLLISPQAVMFEPTDYQSAVPPPPDSDDASATTTAAVGEEAASPAHDCVIVPMDSISSIMISHDCTAAAAATAVSTRSVTVVGVNSRSTCNC